MNPEKNNATNLTPDQSPIPDQSTNANSLSSSGQSVDDFFANTSKEFDEALKATDNLSTPDFSQAPIPNNFNTSISSATIFDAPNTIQPSTKYPTETPSQNLSEPKEAKRPPIDLEKQVKKVSTLAVIFGILVVIFSVSTIAISVLYFSQTDNLNTIKSDLNHSQKIVDAIRETTGVDIKNPSDVPVYKTTVGYIYINEWNIKIKIPDSLDKVSYILNQNYRPSICFNAIQKGVQHFPDFANIALNPGRMGCLTRIATNEGEFDPATGISFGTKVFTYKDYSYFYTPSTDYSKDTASLGLEHTAVQNIKNMLTDNIERYE